MAGRTLADDLGLAPANDASTGSLEGDLASGHAVVQAPDPVHLRPLQVQTVPPAAGTSALKHGPAAGIPPDAAMHDPGFSENQANLNTQQSVLATSPHVRSFVAASNDATVAATKNEWSAFARLGETAQDYWGKGGPFGDVYSVYRQGQQQAGQGGVDALLAQQHGDALGIAKGFGESVLGGLTTIFSPFAAVTEPGARVLNAAPSSTFSRVLAARGQAQRPAETPEDKAAQSEFAANLLLSVLPGPKVFFRKEPSLPGEPGPALGGAPHPTEPPSYNPEGFVADPSGQRATFSTARDAAKYNLQTSGGGAAAEMSHTYVENPNGTYSLQERQPTAGPGGTPESDLQHKAEADLNAAKVADTQKQLTLLGTHEDLPNVSADFLQNHTPVGQQFAWVDPRALEKIYGDTEEVPFQALQQDIFTALRSGRDVQVPLSQYMAETAGKPWEDELRQATRFSENGVSQEEAKNLSTTNQVDAMQDAIGEGYTADANRPLGPREQEHKDDMAQAYKMITDFEMLHPGLGYAEVDRQLLLDPAYKALHEKINSFIYTNEELMASTQGMVEAVQAKLPPGFSARRHIFGEGTPNHRVEVHIHNPEGKSVFGNPQVSRELWEELFSTGRVKSPMEHVREMEGFPSNDTEMDELAGFIEEQTTKASGTIHAIEEPVEIPSDLTEFSPFIKPLAAKVEQVVDQIFREQFLTQLFTDPKALGMDKGQFERYSNAIEEARAAVRERVLERTYNQLRRERTPEWKKQVEALQPHFARDLENHPDVRAARFLAEKGYKLDRDAVESFYPGSASRLPSNILAKNGTNPDDVADLLGYRSGAEMVSNLADLADGMRLAGAKNITEFIHKSAMDAAESQARSNLGYDITPEGLLRAVREAATESPVETFLTKELQTLGKVANLPFSKADLTAEAGRQFNLLLVSEATNLKTFERGMWSNGNKIETKLLKEDPVQAFRLKQAQFLNYLQLRMAHKLVKRMRMDGRTWARVARKVGLTNTSQDAVNWTKDILATIGLPVRGNPEDLSYPINGYNSLGEFIAAKNGLGAQIINAPVVRASAPTKLPVGQYMGISDMIRSILKNGRAEKEVRVGEEKQDLEETVDRGVESLSRYTRTITKAEMEQPTTLQAIDRARRYVDSWLVRLEQLMRDFGGRDFDSPFFQVVSRRLETAKGWNLDKRTELAKHFSDLNGSVGKGFDRWLKAKVNVPDLLTPEGDPVFNFHKDVVVAALHLGDEEALRKFAEGWKTDVPTVEAIVHAHMTDQAWKFVEGMWGAFDNLRPEIEAMYRRLTNVTPRMVEPRSFTIPAGGPATPRTLSGGYYPVIYDPARMPKEWVEQLDPQSMLGDHQYTRATPSNTYIKERTGLSAPIRMDLNQIHSRLNQVIHDLAYREALIDIRKFLTHPRLTSAISRKYGPEYVGKIRRNLERIARSESTDTNENHAVSKAVDWLTEGQMINMIGFSPTTLMKHGITALGQPFAEVGAARYAAAWGDMLRDLNGAAREASAESPEIRHIISMYGEDSYQQFLALTEKRGLFAQYKRFAFHTIGAVNKRIAIATYNAAKQMLLDRGHDELTAQAGANQIVRQALGSTGVTDAPDALSAGRSVPGRFYRLDNNFLTFFSHMYNKSREIPQSLGYAGEKVDLSRAFAVFLASIVLPVLVDAEVGRKVKQGGSWIGALALSLVHQVTRPVPGLNTTVAAGLHVATHGEEPTTDSPTASLGTMVGTSANDVHKALKDHAVTNSMIRHALILGGQILHGPGLEASRLEGWFNAMREGKEQDKPLPQQLEDFIYGPKETPSTGRGHSRSRGRRP